MNRRRWKDHEVKCGCNSTGDKPYIFDMRNYRIKLVSTGKYSQKCPECGYYPWVRLNKRRNDEN